MLGKLLPLSIWQEASKQVAMGLWLAWGQIHIFSTNRAQTTKAFKPPRWLSLHFFPWFCLLKGNIDKSVLQTGDQQTKTFHFGFSWNWVHEAFIFVTKDSRFYFGPIKIPWKNSGKSDENVFKKIIYPTEKKTPNPKPVYLTEKSNLMMTSNYLQDNTETCSGRISIQQTSI